ncbi:MAG: bifunctional 2',3'-cyclic-nucleotide 2'-phosphodiesterase/3'-nucleotidase [Rubrivivax sp.]|nr:bifunctional 2',3'-cyclic-nucleotide 2'-phosphodiesterase/3'-nucleotidase [Rubrivivax sp.]
MLWVLACALAVCAAAAQAQQLKLRILGTTDLHVSLLAYDYYQDQVADEYGLARTATLIEAARSEVPNTLLFDNGDLLQGNPLGDYVARVQPLQPGQVHPAYKVMNALGYDAANIGNHEFNYGLPFLRRAIAGAAFPYVSANVIEDAGPMLGEPAFKPYVMLQRSFVDEAGNGQVMKIGVIGFVPPQFMQWDRSSLSGKVAARDIPATARALVPKMRAEGSDVVVVLAHSGFEFGQTVFFAENTVARLAEVPGVDAIVFGHSHGEFPGRFFNRHAKVDLERGTINGVPAVMAGFWGSHLGVIDLVLDKSAAGWKVGDARGALRPVFDRSTRQAVAADPMVAELVRAEHEGTLASMRAKVAQTLAPIYSYFAQVADDPSVQLVSRAQMAYGKKALAGTPHAALPLLSAAAPFKTGGSAGAANYTDMPAGPLAVRNVADLYVYPNTVDIVKSSGAQVRQWLEMSATAFNRIDPAGAPEQELINSAFPSFNLDTPDGVRYRIDVTQPARYDRSGKLVAPDARRIARLLYDGKPIDEAAMFAVVTNNYRASGGGNFPGLDGSTVVLHAPDENRAALLQYLQAVERVEPTADGNWSIVPVPGVKLRFTSSASAALHLARHPQIRFVAERGDGLAQYELVP